MNKTPIEQLRQYIDTVISKQSTVRPRTLCKHLNSLTENYSVAFNRFSKKFILTTPTEVYQVPVNIPITQHQFVKILIDYTFIGTSHGLITKTMVSLSNISLQSLADTTRKDALSCLTIVDSVDSLNPGSHADNCAAIYEEVYDEISELVKSIATPEEFSIFQKTGNGIKCPHIVRTYDNVDRNVTDRNEFLANNFKKMQAGLFTSKQAVDESTAMPAFFISLSRRMPRTSDGHPLIVEPPKNLTSLDQLLTANVKNTSSGIPFISTKGGPTKQQVINDAAIVAQNILRQLENDEEIVPIIPATVSLKTENIKAGKGGRYFFMESVVHNILMQIAFGHVMDNQHQIPLSGFFNGLSTERGIGRYCLTRILRGFNIDIKEIEKLISLRLKQGLSLTQISDDMTNYLVTATCDFTNFEFYHNIIVGMIDHLSSMVFYSPGPQDKLFSKLHGYLFECVAILELAVGGGSIIRPGAMAMASGQFRTLVGNTGRNECYMNIGILTNIMKQQLPPTKKEASELLNAIYNMLKQGDDGFTLIKKKFIKYVIQFFANIQNELLVKVKPEFRNLISNHPEKLSSIATNMPGDFLKSCITFDPITSELVFSRPFESFLLRLVVSNNSNVQPMKLLQTARSFALSSAMTPMATLYAEKIFDKAMNYLRSNKLITPGTSDKDLFIDSHVVDFNSDVDLTLDDGEQQKWSMKHVEDPNNDTSNSNIISFPTQDEIMDRVTTDSNFMARLASQDSYYSMLRLNKQVYYRYIIDSGTSTMSCDFH